MNPIFGKLYGKNSTVLAEIEKLVGFFLTVLDKKENLLCFFTRGMDIIHISNKKQRKKKKKKKMPTLSIIKSENKYAFTYSGEEDEITPMLTQCGLRDELLAKAIIKSALIINQTMLDHRSKLFGLKEMAEESEL